MSTFKVQPVYGELIYGWLDVAYRECSNMTVAGVLWDVRWNFRGGTLGSYTMKYHSDSSGTKYPDGLSSDIAEAGEGGSEWAALHGVLRRRFADGRKRTRSLADWTTSYYAMRSIHQFHDCVGPSWTGISAVYRTVDYVWQAGTHDRGRKAWDALVSYTIESTIASAGASHQHVPTAVALVKGACAAAARTSIPRLSAHLAEFDVVLRHTGSAHARTQARKIGKRLMSGDEDPTALEPRDYLLLKTHVAGRAVWAGHGWCAVVTGNVLCVLSRSDIVRVHQMLTAICSGWFAAIAQVSIAPGEERAKRDLVAQSYERQVARVLDLARQSELGREVLVCKSLKRAFSAVLGELSGPLCADETVKLWAEAASTVPKWSDVIHAWGAEALQWRATTCFNVGKVYKICPAPDACPALTLIERHEMVSNHNHMEVEFRDEFRSVLRAEILKAYIKKPGVRLALRDGVPAPDWWANYRKGDYDAVRSREIHTHLAWEGTATMPPRRREDPSLWKDSGLGWDSYDVAVDPERPKTSGNMLTRMVYDPSCAMPGIEHYGHPHEHKIDTKPEGHKDPARGIYSGNLRDRLNQSWMEAAVDEVARFHSAYMIGADAEAREARVRALTDRPADHRHVALYYSFDISGWSPRMPPEAQRISHEIWADLYSSALFRSAHNINEGARVYMNKAGYTGWYINPGANFEGYNGKEMTVILIALMSLTVTHWRARVVAAGLCDARQAARYAAMLLAYIDDGLAKLVVPREIAGDMFSLFKDTSVTVFAACGYNIEPSKCYPSDRFAVFLNEPYLAGRHVVHGTRAAMTICAENVEPHTSIIERTTAVSTGCRGAVTAGLDALAGTVIQAYHVYKHLKEWVSWPSPVVAAVWSFMPRAWGGLGLPTMLQLCTSGGGAASEEGAYTMQRWATISPAVRKAFLSASRGAMQTRTSTGVLLSPLGGRLLDGPMVETRVPEAVRRALVSVSAELSPLAREFIAFSSPESLADFAEATIPQVSTHGLQEQVIMDLASTHPHALFSAFAQRIEKSSTLISLVGFKKMADIMRANRRDAAASYRVMKSRLGVS